jgi:hypothetical protein
MVKKSSAETTKSDEVRSLASAMKGRGEKPRPSVIVAELKKQGVDVAAAQVSIVLKKMGFRSLRKRKGSAKVSPVKASVVSVEDLLAAKKVVGNLGGTDKAIAALQALKKFEG